MSGFDGTWQQISMENVDNIMKAWTANVFATKRVTRMNPSISIKEERKVWKTVLKINSLMNLKSECTEDLNS